jgi:CRP-like cAMP-binding protein
LLKEVVRMSTGQEFGEVALANGGKRSGTIVALRDTHFMVLNKEAYEKTIGGERSKQNASLLSLVKSVYYFTQTHRKILQTFMHMKAIETHHRGVTLIVWGKPVDKLYIIVEGEVTLTRKRMPMVRQNKDMINLVGGYMKEAGGDSQEMQIPDTQESQERPPLLSDAVRSVVRLDELCIRGHGQTFGEEYLISNMPSYYRATVTSETATFATLPAEVVRHKLFNQLPDEYHDFEELIYQKHDMGFPWKMNIEVPLRRMESRETSMLTATQTRGHSRTQSLTVNYEQVDDLKEELERSIKLQTVPDNLKLVLTRPVKNKVLLK